MMTDENKRVKITQGIKDALNALKKQQYDDAQKAKYAAGTELPESVYRYKAERDSAKTRREHETLIQSEKGVKTVAQVHQEAQEWLAGREQTTYQDIGTAIMNLVSLYLKAVDEYSQFFYELPNDLRQFVEAAFPPYEGWLDKCRSSIEHFRERGVDFDVVAQDISALVSFGNKGINIDMKPFANVPEDEKQLFKRSVELALKTLLAEHGYGIKRGKYVRTLDDGTLEQLTAQKFEAIRKMPEKGLESMLTTHLEMVCPALIPVAGPRP